MTIHHNIEVAKNADVTFAVEWSIDDEPVEPDDVKFAIKQAATVIEAELGDGITYEDGQLIVLIDRTALDDLVVGAATYDMIVIVGGVDDRLVAGGVSVVEGSVQWASA